MKPAPFKYLVPDTVEEAMQLLSDYGLEARLLAGGQSLVPAMNFRLATPALLIDLNRLSSLDFITKGTEGLAIGAMTRQRAVERHAEVNRLAPLLAEGMPFIAHPQIRNRGTVGGSLAHADPAAELPVLAVALKARLLARSCREDRWIAAEDFFVGLFATSLQPDEMVAEIQIPLSVSSSGWSFQEVARRHGDYAMAGVAVSLTLDDEDRCQTARIVFLNVGDGPMRAPQAEKMLTEGPLTPDLIRGVSEHASEQEIDPVGDLHASSSFKKHLARVLASRALVKALERARSK